MEQNTLVFKWIGDKFVSSSAASKLEKYMLKALLLDPNKVIPAFDKQSMEVFTNLDEGNYSFKVPRKLKKML